MLSLQELEKSFNRALRAAFSKHALILTFPVLALCGFLAVICRVLSYGSGQWIQMSLGFLPIFLCGGLLLAAGIVINRIYYQEVKGQEVQLFQTIKRSSSLFWGISYLTVPVIFTYLILWMLMGVFYLLRAIPAIGEFLGSVFSFGPFLLVFGSLALGLLTLLTLFFLTPAVAKESELSPEFAKKVFLDLQRNPFFSFAMPLIALLPLLITVGFLSLSIAVTQIMYIGSGHSLSLFFKWLFMMVPFCLLLTPPVVFFFHFSFESYILMRKARAE